MGTILKMVFCRSILASGSELTKKSINPFEGMRGEARRPNLHTSALKSKAGECAAPEPPLPTSSSEREKREERERKEKETEKEKRKEEKGKRKKEKTEKQREARGKSVSRHTR